ncbi:ShlB/FhaC/HecB family hemolysin secretion/activation protein [Sphingomonas morindae]|uniref:ShlB/FhaC/HecB family hemolysin secretion/activation protein n=1 Tax=Sphingomonas morindae TaxID=1541170 RepID=A0ABY4X776_9SPHN|nr:ShlB/FhaC/HecB family hemolysin secretion/activation protein [Sphingomonas morindae]USI72778.1 hypothetical protein LHA26_16140 [Sphingomonas morindae]
MQVPLDLTDPALAAKVAPAAPLAAPPRPTLAPGAAVGSGGLVLPGVAVASIRVAGGEDLPKAMLDAAIAPFVGHRLTVDDMRDLLAAVSGVARAQGYVFARSTAPAQTLPAGLLTIALDKGHIDDVRLTGARNAAAQAILDRLRGHAPKRAELERALMLAQDLPGVRLGEARFAREGDRGVLIVPIAYDRVAGHAWTDNWGNHALGPLRASVAFDFNGVFDDRDQLSVSDLATPAQPRELNVIWARYAHQLNASGTELAVFGAYGRTRTGGIWRQYDANGRSITTGASLAQPLVRGRSVSLWLNGEFDYLAVDQWFAGAKVRRDRLATVNVSINGFAPLAGGRIRAGLGVIQGLDVFGATDRGDPLASRPDAGGRFTTASLWSNWTGDIAGPFSARLAVAAQLSTRPLLAVEQLSIGGPSFGRAFDFSERSGDRGVLGSAELQAKLVDRTHGLLRWAQLYGFADAGTVGNLRNAYGTGTLYSAGLGARALVSRSLRLGFEAAFPIGTTRYETGDRTPRLSGSASISF